MWKSSFIKVRPGWGYHPFFLDERRRPLYPLKWSPPMRHEDWSFKNLLLDDQQVVVKLLAVAPLDAQAIISELSLFAMKMTFVVLTLLIFLCRLLG